MNNDQSGKAVPLYWLSTMLLLVAFAALAALSRNDADPDLIWFAAICTAAFSFSLIAARAIFQAGGRITIRHVVYCCVLVRAIALFGEPIYEDDYYRYLWDGRQTVESGGPYRQSPSASFAVEENPVWTNVLDNINYPELRTVYGPTNQYVFALAYLISPGDVFVLQVMMAVTDMVIVGLLTLVAPLWAVALYGFSPLIIKEFAMTAHPDVLSVAALLCATLAWQRDRLRLAAVALAVAVAGKLFALLLVPFLLRKSVKCWAIFLASLVVLYTPIFAGDGSAEALQAMAQSGLFNAPLYFLLESYVDVRTIRMVLLTLFVALYAWYLYQFNSSNAGLRAIPRGDLLFLAMLLALPIFNPWYFVFVLAYAAIHPSVWAWTGSITVLFAYATGLQLDDRGMQLYEQPAWALVAEFIPILLALLVPILRRHWGPHQS